MKHQLQLSSHELDVADSGREVCDWKQKQRHVGSFKLPPAPPPNNLQGWTFLHARLSGTYIVCTLAARSSWWTFDQGAPAYGSAPHFLSGAGDLSSNVTIKGLKPSRELHTTFLNVEPLSGVAFQVIQMIMISKFTLTWDWEFRIKFCRPTRGSKSVFLCSQSPR